MTIALSDLVPYAHLRDLPGIARAAFAKSNFLESLWIFTALNKALAVPMYGADVDICKLKIGRLLRSNGNSSLLLQTGGLAFGDSMVSGLASSFALPPAKNKIAIYTAQFGGYDPVHEPEHMEDNIDYYYFTDTQDLHSDVFQIIPISCSKWPARLVARCFKALPHIFLKQYETTVWIDSSTYLRGQPVGDILAIALANQNIAIHAHKQRDCVYDECTECRLQKKDLPHNIDNIERLLRRFHYAEHNGLMETAQIFRHNQIDINILNEIWWYFLKNFTIRDQLSLPFIIHCLDIDVHTLPYSQWSNKFSRVYHHTKILNEAVNLPVDIIILVHNNLEITEKCINSLIKKTKYDDYYIHIVDNASDTDTKIGLAALKEKYKDKINIIVNKNNESFSKANNQILKIATRPYVLFLNNDIEIVDENWLTSLVSTMHANKSIGAIGPVLINSDYSLQSAGIYLQISDGSPVMPARHHKVFITGKFVHAISGACFLSRRSILFSLGGFDDGFIYGQEDVDLCLRIRQKGYKVVIDTQTEVMHYDSATRKDTPQKQKNRDLFIAKWDKKILELRLQQMDDNIC